MPRISRTNANVFRLATFVIGAAEIGFWYHTIKVIGQHVSPNGDFLDWGPAVPMTMIVVILALPGIVVSLLTSRIWFAAGLVVLAAAADVVVWSHIVQGFAAG